MTDYTPPPAPGDHRSAKADAKAAKARQKAMRPWFKKKRFILPLVLVAIMVMGGLASGGGSDDTTDVASNDDGGSEASDAPAEDDGPDTFSNNETNRPQDDVTGVTCSVDEIGWAQAAVDVTNNSSGRSSYFIDVSFESEDGSRQFATGSAIINNLEPGQSKSEIANSVTEIPEAWTCRVVEVNRMAS